MLSWVVTFRNVSSGEMLTFLPKAADRQAAIEAAMADLSRFCKERVEQSPWELYAVNRSEP